MQMTFDEYDAMLEKFDSVVKDKSIKPCWPSHKIFTTEILAYPEKNIPICCYLLERAKTTSLEEEKMRFLVQEFVYNNLQLYDPDEEEN